MLNFVWDILFILLLYYYYKSDQRSHDTLLSPTLLERELSKSKTAVVLFSEFWQQYNLKVERFLHHRGFYEAEGDTQTSSSGQNIIKAFRS